MNKKLFILLFGIITLPIVLLAQREIQQILSRAAYKPANIIIDTRNILGPVNKSFSSFAQGGEEPPPMFSAVIPKIKELSPKYIRIDHIYDYYEIVRNNGNEFTYDFSILDKTVDDIIATGTLPFFSLSYMPSVFTTSGSIIDVPSDWNNWKNLIKTTIEHYSGRNNKNLNNVYYEVWNEPELPQFGGWKLIGDKDYRSLYFYAAQGAQETENANKFYLGGPAVGSYYPNWVNNFVSYVAQNNLRLDFYSWHRYTKKPSEYVNDAKNIRNLLSAFPSSANIPLFLTEWGIDSENTDINNSNTAAAYAIYSISQFTKDISLAFHFEVKDGPPPNGGKWGLIPHEKNPDNNLSPKPKFKAFRELTKIAGNQILLSGDGTNVSGIAASSPAKTVVILANYDISGRNIENVPVTFTGLVPAMYNLKYYYVLDDRSGFFEIPVTNGNLGKTFLLPANSILFLELSIVSPLATFINGLNSSTGDKALILNNIDGPLMLSAPEFHLQPTGSVNFDIKPFWDKNDKQSFFILEAPFEIKDGIIDKISLSKQKTSDGNLIVFSVSQESEEIKLSLPIDNWESNTWHHVEFGWGQNELWINVDGVKIQKLISLDIRNGKTVSFSPIEAALDNVKILVGKDQMIERHFDGRVDK